MKNGLFLQDALDTSCFVSHAFNLIIAPCGSGKTTAAIKKIAALASSPRKALFLIDTQNGNQRLAQNEALIMPYVFFAETAGTNMTWGELLPDKTVVSTYAQFGVWVKDNPAFAANLRSSSATRHTTSSFSLHTARNPTSPALPAMPFVKPPPTLPL